MDVFDFPNVTAKSFFLWGVQVPRAQNPLANLITVSQKRNCGHASGQCPQRKGWPWVGMDVMRPSSLWLHVAYF